MRSSNAKVHAIALLLCLVVPACKSRQVDKDREEQSPIQDVFEADSKVVATDFSSDSRYLALLSKDGELTFWDVLRGKKAGATRIEKGSESSLDLASRERFAVVTPEGVQVRDKTERLDRLIPEPPDSVLFIRFDAEARRLAVAHRSGRVSIWTVETGMLVETIPALPKARGIFPGGSFALIYDLGPETIRIRGLESAGLESTRLDVTLEFTRKADTRIHFTESARRLASISPEGKVEIRSLPTGELIATLNRFSATPSKIALSPDGSVLAVAVEGKRIELWEVAKNELLDTFESGLGIESGITFSPDGNFIAWVDQNGKDVRFWSPVSGAVVWDGNGPKLIEKATTICVDLATTIRFRQAMKPFKVGTERLLADDLAGAREALNAAAALLPTYPGLAGTRDETEERFQAKVQGEELRSRLAEFERKGEYYKSLTLLDAYLRDHARHDRFNYTAKAMRLRAMLRHFEVAEAHRQADRKLEAIQEFERAAAVYPGLGKVHPEYTALRQALVKELSDRVLQSHEEKKFAELIEVYGHLGRLRPLESSDRLLLGEAHQNVGQRKRAQENYESIPEKSPDYAEARTRLGRMARQNGDLDTARREFETARRATPRQVSLEMEYAEVCELLKDFDEAVRIWNRVAELEPENPDPLERIGKIEEARKNWTAAAEAYRTAVRRSPGPRPQLLVKVAESHGHGGNRDLVLDAYVELLGLVEKEVPVPWLGKKPRQRVVKWIRELGFVLHRGDWIPREQFLAEQGWVRFGDSWLRPEEARLREVVQRFETNPPRELRSQDNERYEALAQRRGISRGMNREELITAWGFFDDLNLYHAGEKRLAYEQLIFPNGRQVYLRDGLVCFWTE